MHRRTPVALAAVLALATAAVEVGLQTGAGAAAPKPPPPPKPAKPPGKVSALPFDQFPHLLRRGQHGLQPLRRHGRF